MKIDERQILADVSNEVPGMDDRHLNSPGCIQKLERKYQIEIPVLIKNETKTSIEERVMTWDNGPGNGIKYSPGRPMEYAQFVVPFKGSQERALELFKYLLGRQGGLDGKHLYIRIFTGNRITNSNPDIEKAQGQFLTIIQKIENVINGSKPIAERFNEQVLFPHIKSAVEREIKNRSLKANSESKLNPFG